MRATRLFPLLLVLALLQPLAARAQREKFTPDDLDLIEKAYPSAQRTNMGVRFLVEQAGSGAPPVPGDVVTVIYTGSLLHGGRVFDKSPDRAHPFIFRVGRGYVIRGWDHILQLMRPGERRLVIIPAELAYGSRGSLPRIPRDAPLVFEVELVSVRHEP